MVEYSKLLLRSQVIVPLFGMALGTFTPHIAKAGKRIGWYKNFPVPHDCELEARTVGYIVGACMFIISSICFPDQSFINLVVCGTLGSHIYFKYLSS